MDIGTLIKTRRKELNMTQEDLCEGICEPVTISRIENGKQIPSTEHLKAILERLNLPTQQIICLVPSMTSSIQAQFKEVLDEVDSYFQLSNKKAEISYEQLKTKITNLECYDSQSKQLKFLLQSALTISNNELDNIELSKKTVDMIHLTYPDFTEKNIKYHFLNYNEFLLIFLLALLYYSTNKHEIAEVVIQQLGYHLDNHFSFENNSDFIMKHILIFLFFIIQANEFNFAIRIGKFAKNQCIKYQQFKYLGYLYEQLSQCTTNIDERNDYINKAYYMYVSTENENGIQRINELKKKLNL